MAKRRGAGEGSIYKRKDGTPKSKWAASVIVGYDPETNNPKRKTFYGASRKEVVDKLNHILIKTNNGTYNEPAKLKLADWLDTWLNDYMKSSLRPTTWASYEVQVRKHIKPSLGQVKLSQLTTTHLQRLYNDKLEGGRGEQKGGGLSPRSVRYIHAVLRGALEQAKKEGMLIINPADAVKLPTHEKKEINFFDNEAVSVFLSKAKGTHYFAVYYLELATGLRRGELLGLRWADIDLHNGTVSVNRGLIRLKGGLAFQAPKTKLAKRTISIPPGVVAELKAHKVKQAEKQMAAGKLWKQEQVFLDGKAEKNDLVFTNEIGEPVCPRALTRHFERLLKKVGLPKIAFHDLRHTYATLCLQQGVDMKTTSENLGHFDPGFTLSVYSGVTNKMKQEATDKIGDLLANCLNNK
jgi:integrase